MRILVLVASVGLTWGLWAQEQTVVRPEDKCSVEGHVYSAKTGEPLGKAEVSNHPGAAHSAT